MEKNKIKAVRLTEDQIVRIAEGYIAGVSVLDLAKELKVKDGQVRSALGSLRKAGVGFPKHSRQGGSVYRDVKIRLGL